MNKIDWDNLTFSLTPAKSMFISHWENEKNWTSFGEIDFEE